MKKVTVLRLSGCRFCEELVEKLDNSGIAYTALDANENGELADQVEDYLNTTIYPMVLVENSNPALVYIVRAKEEGQAGEFTLKEGIKIVVTSVDSMINVILKLN